MYTKTVRNEVSIDACNPTNTSQTTGSFEYEYQAAAADSITVSENKTPGTAPTGFEFLEPSTFKVALAQSKGEGLTLSKIDFIFDAAGKLIQIFYIIFYT